MNLEELRTAIDEIDRQLVTLLRERARLAQQIGQEKGRLDQRVYAPERELAVCERLADLEVSPLRLEALRAIYREIISACREVQRRLVIAFLGPEGTFTQIAGRQVFGSGCEYRPLPSVADVFYEVEKGRADHGIVPIENSSEGSVRETMDMFLQAEVRICAEVYVDIHHCLLAKGPREQIRVLYSNPQALAQCRQWLRTSLPKVELVATTSTAQGAARAAQEPQAAAIGTSLAAELYGLDILEANIEDQAGNRTRFLVLGREDTPPTGRDKTSLIISTQHRAGALCEALSVLRDHQLNMTMIESRPARYTAWAYVFFIDFQGHLAEEHVRQALSELEERCLFVRVLGSYPEAGD